MFECGLSLENNIDAYAVLPWFAMLFKVQAHVMVFSFSQLLLSLCVPMDWELFSVA